MPREEKVSAPKEILDLVDRFERNLHAYRCSDRTEFPGDVVETDKPRSLKASYKPCLTGKNIDRYVTEFAKLYCLFDRVAQQGGCWDEEIQFAKNKIIVRQIGKKPIAAFDARGLCCLNTVFMIKTTVEGIDEKFLLGILNSKAIGFFWQNKFSDFKETFPKIKGTYLQQLPIPTGTNPVTTRW